MASICRTYNSLFRSQSVDVLPFFVAFLATLSLSSSSSPSLLSLFLCNCCVNGMRMIIVAIIILNWEIMAHRVSFSIPFCHLVPLPFPHPSVLTFLYIVAYFFAVIANVVSLSLFLSLSPVRTLGLCAATAVYFVGFVC